MKGTVTEHTPLTDLERDWLLRIYTLRRGDLFFNGVLRCVAICLPIFTCSFVFVAVLHDNVFQGHDLWTQEPLFYRYLLVALLLAILTACFICWLAYKSWILPYKLDALSGIKETVRYNVIEKQYYPVTGQYYLKLQGDEWDDHHEVSEETYNACEEGGRIFMYRAIKSQHMLHKNDHVKIKLFYPSRFRRGYYSNY